MKSPRFLVIRRDNIGDLVCTTPLINGIRRKHPGAWIGVVANSYNAPVLAGNPDIDTVCAYRKAKHGGTGIVAAAWQRLKLLRQLRGERIDYAVVATPNARDRGLNIARFVNARHVVAFGHARGVDRAVSLENTSGLSEVELVWRVARTLGIDGPPPALKVVPPQDVIDRVQAAIANQVWSADGPLVAIHISARKPSQRWPFERFAELMRALNQTHNARFLVLWSPGAETNLQHPGDDAKARQLADATQDLPVLAWSTTALPELIGALAVCDAAVLADGGAMHIAAALGKPLVALFGDSDATRWKPWGVRHEILQPQSRDVSDVAVKDVVEAFERLAVAQHRAGQTA